MGVESKYLFQQKNGCVPSMLVIKKISVNIYNQQQIKDKHQKCTQLA